MEKTMMKKKSLPEELIVEILLKLPMKSLLRFRCVSKYWCNFIKSPSFINSHFIEHKDDKFITLICAQMDESLSISFRDYESLGVISPDIAIPQLDNMYLDVCGPCNGLISMADIRNIVLCNPSMREFRVISPATLVSKKEYDTRIISIGMGFDSNSNTCKVITFIELRPNDNYTGPKPTWEVIGDRCGVKNILCLIYYLGSNTWREIDHKQHLGMRYIEPTPSGVLFKGVFHWIAWGVYCPFIFLFDMTTEVFGRMKLPNRDLLDCEEFDCLKLSVLNDSLALFYTKPDPQCVDIWVRKHGVSERWTKQFTIGPVTGIDNSLLLWKNEALLLEASEEVEHLSYLSYGYEDDKPRLGSLFSFALDTGVMVDYGIQGVRNTFRVLVSQESLVSIK